MSTEEIINSWKNEQPPAKKPDRTPASPKPVPGQAPTNPVGEQALNDEDLEIIEGGLVAEGSFILCSCELASCN